jgi:hypothetical protein
MSTNSCTYCGKSYTRKSSYDRHLILCEVAYKSKREKKCEEEESTDIPSVAKLYAIIQEMAYKQEKMEEKMEEMQKWIDKKKTKLNVVKWLNSQPKPQRVFEDRVKSFIVIEEDVTTLVENNFVSATINILKRNLKTGAQTKEPIACFTEKAAVFYIYKNQEIEAEGEGEGEGEGEVEAETKTKTKESWIKMSQEDFVFMLRNVHFKLLNALCLWRDKNAERINSNDKFAELYNKTVIKLMGADFNQESTLSKIRSPLYNHLKEDMKNVEHELE